MTEEGHEERFPPPRLNGRCRFGQATFIGTHGNERDAPILAIRGESDRSDGCAVSGHSRMRHQLF